MKCYYEELEIEYNASDNEIKSAYRKLALKWHPDKNPECIEAAKERFQLIQQAYDILSDPQERAWYDNHREQILRGKNSNFEDNCLNLFQYFNASCFKGYGDDENGFYGVFQEVFKKISAEDAEFMDSEEDILKIPMFGHSRSNYEQVVGPFYAYWSAYCTKRTYSWLCPYDIREVKDRRILREIEKKMRKVVQKARKERNEEVRSLVSFIRKRDHRVKAFNKALEARTTLNREKQERNRMEQKRRRQQELAEMRLNSQEAYNNDDYEEQLKQLEMEYSSEDSFGENDIIDEFEKNDEVNSNPNDGLYCIACNKEFKTKKSFANHEISRKHRDNIEKLKIEMQSEENFYLQEERFIEVKDVKTANSPGENKTNNLYSTEDSQALTKIQNKTRKKSTKNVKQSNLLDLKTTTEEVMEAIDILNVEDDGDWETRNKKLLKKNKNKRLGKNKSNALQYPVEIEKHSENNFISKSEALNFVCATCKATFESKNKLFSHLKLLNHAIFVPIDKNTSDEHAKLGKTKKK